MGFGRRLEVSTGLECSDLKVKYAQRSESMTKYRNIKYTVLIYTHTGTASGQHWRKRKTKRNKSHITKSACRIRMRKVSINI